MLNATKLLERWKNGPGHTTFVRWRRQLTSGGVLDLDTVLNLLHSGFSAQTFDILQDYDREILYLGLADGWSLESGYAERRIRRKALEVLTMHSFKGDPWRRASAKRALEDLRLAQKYLWFFRTELKQFFLSEGLLIFNLPAFHNIPDPSSYPGDKIVEYVLEFVKEFAITVWKSSGILSEGERCSALDILHCADPKSGLWSLLPGEPEQSGEWNKFNKVAQGELDRIARRYARSDEAGLSVEKLALRGSIPAQVLMLVRSMLAEIDRQDAVPSV